MKKKSNDILVYIGMAFLALLIIVPPVLRVAVPKEAVNNNPVLKDKVVLLTCNKTSDDGSYQINSKTKFLNGEANTVTLTYKVSAQENTDTDTGADPCVELYQAALRGGGAVCAAGGAGLYGTCGLFHGSVPEHIQYL